MDKVVFLFKDILVLLPPATKLGQGNIFRSVCPHSVHGGVCVVAPRGREACMVARGVRGCSLGEAWLLGGVCGCLGGVCGCYRGGMHGCSRGLYVVAPGGRVWLLWGACMVAHGGMHGCSRGACMVAPGGVHGI